MTPALFWLALGGACKRPEKAEKESQLLPEAMQNHQCGRGPVVEGEKPAGKDIQVQTEQAWAYSPLFSGQVSI